MNRRRVYDNVFRSIVKNLKEEVGCASPFRCTCAKGLGAHPTSDPARVNSNVSRGVVIHDTCSGQGSVRRRSASCAEAWAARRRRILLGRVEGALRSNQARIEHRPYFPTLLGAEMIEGSTLMQRRYAPGYLQSPICILCIMFPDRG